MARNRNNGAQGEVIDLYAFFYKDGELAQPSSIGPVKILYDGSVVESIAASNVADIDSGIKKLSYTVDATAVKGRYNDLWTSIIYDPGDDYASSLFEFNVATAEWEAKSTFELDRLKIIVQNNDVVKLNEKKWLKFEIKDENANLQYTDRVSLLLKDFNGSNVYLSSVTVNDYLNAFYYFNSSKLRYDYPDYIDRDNTYEWILKVEYRGREYLPDPIQFKFSET